MTKKSETDAPDSSQATAGAVAVDEETAAADFDRLVDVWDLDMDVKTADDRQSLDDIRQRLEREIIRGRAYINDEGNYVYTIQYPLQGGKAPTDPDMVFTVPDGSTWLKLDGHKEQATMRRTMEMIGGMTHRPAAFFTRVDGRDMKLLQAVAGLFLTR